MPEIRFTIRWPDGTAESCYSPSLVIRDYFAPGTSYPLVDFLEKSREALTVASQRVEARYGFPCSRALGQLARIEAGARAFSAFPNPRVTVEAFDA